MSENMWAILPRQVWFLNSPLENKIETRMHVKIEQNILFNLIYAS
jgi:hypothetical protein